MNTKTTLHFGIRRGAVPGYLFEGLFTFVGIVLLGVGFFLSINSLLQGVDIIHTIFIDKHRQAATYDCNI